MGVARLLPTVEAHDLILIELTRELCDQELVAPIVDRHEKAYAYSAEAFQTLVRAGLLSLPFPEVWGGGGQGYEVCQPIASEKPLTPSAG